MKRKLLGSVLLVLVAATLTAFAETDDIPRGHNPLRKLGRGVSNILFGVVEVPNQVTKVTSEHGGGAGATYGIGKGFVRWIGRELTGVYDVVTFAVPYPAGYKPIMQPEFPIEDFEP